MKDNNNNFSKTWCKYYIYIFSFLFHTLSKLHKDTIVFVCDYTLFIVISKRYRLALWIGILQDQEDKVVPQFKWLIQ